MSDNFDQDRKQRLNDRILTSIDRYDSRMRIKRICYISSIAAILVMGIFTYVYFDVAGSPSMSIQKTASSTKLFPSGSDVRLILNNQEVVNIAEEKPELVYSNTGKTVNINNGRSLTLTSYQTDRTGFNTIVVPLGKKSQLTLSDGSKVWINSGSRLTYPTIFAKGIREVVLQGEAIFDVAHDAKSPFHVLTDDNDIKVLGTIFNVSSYADDDYVSTALQSGSVEITYTGQNRFLNTKKSIKIIPGTLASYNKKKQKINTRKTDLTPYFSWRNGELIFQNNDLQSIMKRISRHYGIDISIADGALARQTFSGNLDINTDLDTVMEIMKRTSKFEFEKKDNRIIITNPNIERR
ncbi:FecR family protein [Pricia antarctica]|uniref:FecR family protein n=1 Tax=Pricia antarctica TaxID=641691 RepID=A0A1G7G797_9FLAO|nr:FecR domain-containing protein [Pricia antarctica]SDE84006.1 FecR family protein [Pricia antarctica]